MTHDRDIPPADLRALARERSKARRERRFADADRIRAEIEAQGWNVVDRGAEARLVRAHPLDVLDPDGVTRFGWSGAVPEVRATGVASVAAPITVILRALPEAGATDSLMARLASGGTSPKRILVVVGEGCPDPTPTSAEVIRLRGDVGPGTLLAVALRRIGEGVVVVGERWPADAAPSEIDVLAAHLDDATVAVTGLVGVHSHDLRRFTPGGAADAPSEAVGWAGLAFRAPDGRTREPVDEDFSDAELLAAWWSLVLRDATQSGGAVRDDLDADAEGGRVTPRRAVAIRTTEPSTDDAPVHDDRATRRDRYRLLDWFGGRDDLLVRDD